MRWSRRILALLLAAVLAPLPGASLLEGQSAPRARDLGIPFVGQPGPFTAITDVAGVEVRHATLIAGEGRHVRGEGPVRTGVTAATDAPLLPHQLKQVARRVALGMGGMAGNNSGDIFLAFSTANRGLADARLGTSQVLSNDVINPIFEATVHATEEAITNALIAAHTMVGRDYLRVEAIRHERLRAVLLGHGRPDAGSASPR